MNIADLQKYDASMTCHETKMANPSESLFNAILDDDRAGVNVLLKKNPHMAREAVAVEARLSPEIAHWIYVGRYGACIWRRRGIGLKSSRYC